MMLFKYVLTVHKKKEEKSPQYTVHLTLWQDMTIQYSYLCLNLSVYCILWTFVIFSRNTNKADKLLYDIPVFIWQSLDVL